MTHTICAILSIFFLLLTGCAKQGTRGGALQPESNAEAVWQKYCSNGNKQTAFRMGVSLRMGREGDTRRVTGLFWGSERDTLRLDVMAGVGTTIAKIQSTPNSFLLVAPMDGKAYTYTGSKKPHVKLGGMPLPFSLQNLAALLMGSAVDVFGADHGAIEETKGGIRYTIAKSVGVSESLELDGNGNLLSWENAQGWKMQVSHTEGIVDKLDLRNHRGDRFVLFVKERTVPSSFTKEQLELTVPSSFPLLPLEKYTRTSSLPRNLAEGA